MTPFPRPDYAILDRYEPGRSPVALDLSDNTNLWGPHPDALARIRAATPDDVARYPDLYADALRAAVADRFGVEPDCVTTGAGSDDVLDSAFRAAAAAGAVVSYAAPTFSMVEPFTLMNGLLPHPVPWGDALSDPGALLERRPAIVYVCRPNNPTGLSAPRSWLETLCEARPGGGARGPLVILDEAYADFAESSWIGRAAELPAVLVTRTASKAYGLAGLRCGYGVGRADTVLEIDKSRGPYKVSTLASEAVAAAVRDASGWMAGTVDACVRNRERLREELLRRGLDTPPSTANFVLCPAPGGSGADDKAELRELGVGVRPFPDVPGLGDALRVTVGPWPMMETFLAALDRLLERRGVA